MWDKKKITVPVQHAGPDQASALGQTRASSLAGVPVVSGSPDCPFAFWGARAHRVAGHCPPTQLSERQPPEPPPGSCLSRAAVQPLFSRPLGAQEKPGGPDLCIL